MNENVIILRCVCPKNNIEAHILPSKDPKTGRYPDCVRRVDANGDMILSEKDKNENIPVIAEDRFFVIKDGTTFNLDDPHEAAQWEAIRYCKLIEPRRDARDDSGNLIIDGPNTYKTKDYSKAMGARYGIAEFYIEVPGELEARKVSKKKMLINAVNYVINDSKEGMITKAKLLGKNANNMLLADLEDFLIDFAERNPQKMINLYTGEDVHLRLLLIDAMDKRVIVLKNKLYIYSDTIILGATDDAAILWMKNAQNAKLLKMIKEETYPELYSTTPEVKEEVKDKTKKKEE